MENAGVGSWIARLGRNAPRRIAVVSGDAAWTYEDLAARVRRLAHVLRALGVQRGDRVAWLGANHPAFLETLFATGLLGSVLVTVNHRLDESSIARILADSGASVVVSRLNIALPSSVRARIAVDDYSELIARASDDDIDEPVSLDDLCMLPYTSGTTGAPKGVMLTHGNVTWNVVNVLSCADIRSEDVTIAIAPFFRVGGTGVNVLPVLFKGGTVVIPTSSEPDELLDLIERHRVTVGFANPDLLDAMLRASRWPSADLTRVRFFMTGGAPVPERLIRAFLDRGITLLQGYGLSEAAPLALLLDSATALRKVGSAGKPPLLTDVRIVRADGRIADVGETGELQVKGRNVMAGYWNRPDATRSAIDRDGWLRTGDVARTDDEGDVWIVDRSGDEYVSMGQIVYPGDVERVLLAHPAVADAGVVGAPAGGAAFVVLAPGATAIESELLEHCRAQLPAHAVPAKLSLVKSLPRNSVGKLLRRELRAQLVQIA